MKTYLILILTAMIAIFATCTSCSNFNKEPQIDEVIELDSIEQNYEEYLPTIYEILQEREEMRYIKMVDSVYLTMPETILTHILMTKGTTISILEIVEDYINNKEYYHKIWEAIEIHKQYSPDPIPNKPKQDKKLQPIDSLR